MRKNNSALAFIEKRSQFGLKARDVLFDSVVGEHEFFRGQNTNICFVEADGQESDVTDDTPNDIDTGATDDHVDGGTDDNQPTDNVDDKPSNEAPKISNQEAKLLKEVMKWKDKAKTAQQQLDNQSENPLAAIVGDMSHDDIKALIDGKRAQDRQDREARGEYNSIVSQMKEQHTADLSAKDQLLEAKDTEIAELKAMLGNATNELEELTVGRQFSDSPFIKDRATLPSSIARQLFGAHFEIEQGKIVGYDKPRGVEGRTPLVNGQAETLGFEAAIERLITSHPESKTLIRSQMKPGSNSNTINETTDNNAPKKMSGADRIRQALEKGE